MGYTLLYIAFGVVALWLLGEVLLQYKARLRWRLLAFAGFVGVVGGVSLRNVIVIVLGAIAFGTGQTFVTLSYRQGFSTGWALGGSPGSSRRRKGTRGAGGGAAAAPVLEVSPIEEVVDGSEQAPVYQPMTVHDPMTAHEDSGEYPIYDGQSSYTPDPYTSGGYEGYGAQGYEGWGGGEQQPQPAAASADAYAWGGQQGYDPAYTAPYQDHQDTGQQQYSPQYDDQQYGYDTPPGGVWVPHQQSGEQQPLHDPQHPQQQAYIPQQPQQPQYEQPQYADPYDPYRY